MKETSSKESEGGLQQASPESKVDLSPPELLSLFNSINTSISVPTVTWSPGASTWIKPVPLGFVPRPHPDLSISISPDDNRRISIGRSESSWRIVGKNGTAIADIREDKSNPGRTELSFTWLKGADQALEDVAAVELSCIIISTREQAGAAPTCYVFVSPATSGKAVIEDGLYPTTKASGLDRQLEIKPSASITAKHSIEQAGVRTPTATSVTGEPFEYSLKSTYPLTLCFLMDEDSKNSTSPKLRFTLQIKAKLHTGETRSVDEALNYEKEDRLKFFLIEAIKSYASAVADKNSMTMDEVIEQGIREYVPSKRSTDYNKTFNSMTLKALRDFERKAKEYSKQADYPPLVQQVDLIKSLQQELELLPKTLKVNVQIVRQKEVAVGGGGVVEMELFRAGELP